jgi:hypothetical protein
MTTEEKESTAKVRRSARLIAQSEKKVANPKQEDSSKSDKNVDKTSNWEVVARKDNGRSKKVDRRSKKAKSSVSVKDNNGSSNSRVLINKKKMTPKAKQGSTSTKVVELNAAVTV